MAEKQLRCAIYTRKSTEDGLEQNFNSLDAQYEACAAYAVSQRHEGWVLLPDRYDDGGFSGGTMERPGLKRLLADVAACKVDIVLLYKIDRLTRSLADFAKIVEVLDKAGASFVSITQAFNTTTSMGRLTLNMLLSFAQFEREVTAERIRDKIAASKRRGIWTGGSVPTGYLVQNRKLVINEPEAEVVRHIMRRYLELRSVVELVEELKREGYRTERKVSGTGQTHGGVLFSRGMIYWLLSNPVYLGKLSHKGAVFEGEHQAIVSQELWNEVQKTLAANTQGHSRRLKAKAPSLLTGLLFDGEGRAMTPTHATKKTVRFRYYRTRPNLIDGSPAWHVTAHDLEALVCGRLATFLTDQKALSSELCSGCSAHSTAWVLGSAHELAQQLLDGTIAEKFQTVRQLIERVVFDKDSIAIRVSCSNLLSALGQEPASSASEGWIVLCTPATKVWHGRQLRLVIPGEAPRLGIIKRDPELVRLMCEVHGARQLVLANADKSLLRISREANRCSHRLGRLLRLSCLAPDIVTAILEGRQPVGLTNGSLLSMELPLSWTEQRKVLALA